MHAQCIPLRPPPLTPYPTRHCEHTQLSKPSLLLLLLFHSRTKVKCVIYKSVCEGVRHVVGGVACRTTNANSRTYCRRHIFRQSRQQQRRRQRQRRRRRQLQWRNKRNPQHKHSTWQKNAHTLPAPPTKSEIGTMNFRLHGVFS